MDLQDIIHDIHALTEDVEVYERKYGILSETFYELYQNGVEPDDDTWVLDWSDWRLSNFITASSAIPSNPSGVTNARTLVSSDRQENIQA